MSSKKAKTADQLGRQVPKTMDACSEQVTHSGLFGSLSLAGLHLTASVGNRQLTGTCFLVIRFRELSLVGPNSIGRGYAGVWDR
jgi:hypothetical protein